MVDKRLLVLYKRRNLMSELHLALCLVCGNRSDNCICKIEVKESKHLALFED